MSPKFVFAQGWELRQGARRSWVRHLREHFPTIPVKFMLGQPPAEQAETLNMTLLLHQLEVGKSRLWALGEHPNLPNMQKCRAEYEQPFHFRALAKV